jgi:hypothetical protein
MMWNCVVAAALICAPLAVRTCASPDARECDPQRVWDLMIRAKGGRDRFEQVKTFYYSRTQSFGFLRRLRLRQDTLFIVPEFRWSWNQPASSVFRTTVNVIRGKQLIRAEPQRVEYLNAEVWVPYPFINVALYMPGLPVWKPILKGCRVGVGGQTTLVAKLQGGKFIYEFAHDNYLPTKVSVTLGRVTDTTYSPITPMWTASCCPLRIERPCRSSRTFDCECVTRSIPSTTPRSCSQNLRWKLARTRGGQWESPPSLHLTGDLPAAQNNRGQMLIAPIGRS